MLHWSFVGPRIDANLSIRNSRYPRWGVLGMLSPITINDYCGPHLANNGYQLLASFCITVIKEQ